MSSLKEVAKVAGVSLMTVSRAINNPELLKPDTLRHVQEAIRSLNYVPDLSAKRIRGARDKPKTIGVIALDTITTPYSVEITLSIEETARSNGWNSFVVNLFSDDSPKDIVDLVLSHRPDGVIFTTMGLRQVPVPQQLLELPCVLANCESLDHPVASYIPDDEQGQYVAVKALLRCGYQRLLCLHLPKKHLATSRRLNGLLKAIHESGLPPASISHWYMDHGDDHYMDIEIMLKKLLVDRTFEYDAIVCGNDRMAFLVYQVLLTHSIKIPRDVGVLGYDNMVGIGELFVPPLSTVQLPHYEIGRMSALHIINNVLHKDTILVRSPFLNRSSI